MGVSTTFGGSKRSRLGPLGLDTRAGMYSNQAWFAATLRVGAGLVFPPSLMKDCQPSQLNSWFVPHHDEGPAGARVLEVGIVQVRAVHRA
jgi:hypothetical protein